MITGNKGEWSEIYALLKLLGDQKIHAGNSNLQKLINVVYPVIEVIRSETNADLNFSYHNSNVIIHINGINKFTIPIVDFTTQATILLKAIQGAKPGTFSVPTIESFLNSFGSSSIKAKSTVKSDIVIKIHDPRTGLQPTLGFSIKSQLGGDSTILNASQATNFKFQVVNVDLSDEDINRINDISTKSKIMDRLSEIDKLGGKFKFIDALNPVFRNNLSLIDSSLPRILGEAIVYYFGGVSNSLSDIANHLEIDNPLNYDLTTGHRYYEYKLKRLLLEVALGMMPKSVWTGQYDATGGYLVVKDTGEIICYHVYNKNEFEDYLFLNTRFETSSSTRNKFGSLYQEGNDIYFNLNTQIRFN